MNRFGKLDLLFALVILLLAAGALATRVGAADTTTNIPAGDSNTNTCIGGNAASVVVLSASSVRVDCAPDPVTATPTTTTVPTATSQPSPSPTAPPTSTPPPGACQDGRGPTITLVVTSSYRDSGDCILPQGSGITVTCAQALNPYLTSGVWREVFCGGNDSTSDHVSIRCQPTSPQPVRTIVNATNWFISCGGTSPSTPTITPSPGPSTPTPTAPAPSPTASPPSSTPTPTNTPTATNTPSGNVVTITNGAGYSNSNPTANTVYECAPGVVLNGNGSLPHAFTGSANNVTIRNCEITNYNVPGQKGAIQRGDSGSANWVVENSFIHHNGNGIGAGIVGTQGWIIRGNVVSNNGDNGIRANENNTYSTPSGIQILNNEISFNNMGDTDPFVEAGGTKFVNTRGIIIRGNTVFANIGPGIWTDINNSGALIEDNTSFHNRGDGIFQEIGGSAVIRRNTVYGNGEPGCTGAIFESCNQIHISSSSNVEVYENTVTVRNGVQVGNGMTGSGNGIVITEDEREPSRSNSVHSNEITCLNGLPGNSGADFDEGSVHSSNLFDFNHYVGCTRWIWNAGVNFAGFQAAGQEANGVAE